MEWENNILYELLEAGEENLSAMANILNNGEVEKIEKDEFLPIFNLAISNLYDKKFIDFAYYLNDNWVFVQNKDISSILPVEECLLWNDKQKQWMWNEDKMGGERVKIILLRAGRKYIEKQLT